MYGLAWQIGRLLAELRECTVTLQMTSWLNFTRCCDIRLTVSAWHEHIHHTPIHLFSIIQHNMELWSLESLRDKSLRKTHFWDFFFIWWWRRESHTRLTTECHRHRWQIEAGSLYSVHVCICVLANSARTSTGINSFIIHVKALHVSVLCIKPRLHLHLHVYVMLHCVYKHLHAKFY